MLKLFIAGEKLSMEHMNNKNGAGATLYITTEKVIVNLLWADQKKYLPISRLFRFVSYIGQQLEEQQILHPNAKVVFDVNFDAIERTVQYNDMVYDLIGDKIFLKGVLPSVEENDPLTSFAKKFAEEFVA